MNSARGLVEPLLAERLGWALFHSLWQGAVLAVIYSLLRIGLRRCSANTRYAAACLMLVLLLGAPVITALYGPLKFSITAHEQVRADATSASGAGLTPISQAHRHDLGNAASRWLLAGGAFLERCLPSVVTGWIFGVVLVSCRWLQGCWWVRRVRTVQVEPVDAALIAVLEYLKCRFEIQRPVRLVKSALAEVPMVVGWIRPVILLPASALTGLTLEQLESILAHELAHVRRWDYVVNAVQNLIETLLFYHPAVWWISRCVREEREHCCDDLVLRVCQDRVAYARALFRLEELRGVPGRLACAASGGSLLRRIRRLLGGVPEVWPVTVREFSGLTLLAVGCVLLLAGACLLFGKETYSGTARIRVEPERPVAMPGGDREVTTSYDPYYIQTEFEVLQSQVVLGKVVTELNLSQKWGEQYGRQLKTAETMGLLRRQVDLRPVRNTSIIEIKVYDEDPSEAARIANAIARVYADYRARKRQNAAGQGMEALLARLKEQEAFVLRAESNVYFLRKELNLHDTGPDQSPPTMLLSAETLRRVEALRLESQAEYVRSRTLLDRLQSLKPEELIQAIPSTGIQDENLSALLQQQNLVEQNLVAMEKGFGPQYSEVIKLRAQSADLKQKITDRASGILRGLDARASSLKQGLEDLSKEVARATQADVETANKSQPYFQAKRDLEEQMRFRQMLYLKVASEKTDAALPKSGTVEIVDEAFTSPQGSSPDRSRAIGLMVAGLLLCMLGLLLAKSGRSGDIQMASA